MLDFGEDDTEFSSPSKEGNLNNIQLFEELVPLAGVGRINFYVLSVG
jgi:hypothetical protein